MGDCLWDVRLEINGYLTVCSTRSFPNKKYKRGHFPMSPRVLFSRNKEPKGSRYLVYPLPTSPTLMLTESGMYSGKRSDRHSVQIKYDHR